MPRPPVALTALLAGALLGAAPAVTAAPAPAPTGAFTALSYNVAGLPEPLSGSNPARNSPIISPLLNDYDVVLLQEDWVDAIAQDGSRPPGTESIPRTGYHDLVVSQVTHEWRSEPMASPPPAGAAIGRLPTGPTLSGDGLNHLSRVALDGLHREMWDVCHGEVGVTAVETIADEAGVDDPTGEDIDGGSADCGAQKGFSVTTILLGGVPVHLYNLHADAGGHPNDAAARKQNFAELATFIDAYSKDHALILGGDTNLKTTTRAADRDTWTAFLGATGMRDVCEVVDCGDDAGEIDKFAFRSAGGVTIAPQSHAFEREKFTFENEPLSDHDPLAVRFHWSVGGVRAPRRDR